jgi:hypothetical protein
MTKFQRELVGRAAMAVLGLALLWGGVKCFATASELKADDDRRYVERGSPPYRKRHSGAYLPFAIGVVLCLFGAPLVFAAVVPVSWTARLLGRPNQITLHENPEPGGSRWGDLL